MDVFNKLYSQVTSSVSSTVSQLSNVLPGNPVTREYEAIAHIASAGPGLLWKVYKGHKRSTKQEVSIFVFEKRQLEKWNKTDRDIILESLRKGVTQLTKIRHPQVLTVQHPLEESRESLAFTTEPIFASIANILGKTTNMPQPTNMSNFTLFDIEIKYGLLQIAEGLAFLHNDVKLLHKNICPECIIINQQGAWKIFGLDFCVHNTNPPNLPPSYPYEDYSPTLPDVCQPNLDFIAPEFIMAQIHSTASDMFSLGMLIYSIYLKGQTLFPTRELHQFRDKVQQLKNLNNSKLQGIPEGLREFVKLLLNTTPELRPDAHQFAKIPYFDDVGVKTLNYLDSLLQWDNIQKSQFYKGLPDTLSKLPHRVKIQRVLPCLSRDLSQPIMVPFVLPSILDIGQDSTKEEFVNYILPHLKPVMKLMEPIQILLIMLQRMELLLKLTPAEDIQQHVLPMLYGGLDSDTPQIHELCLSVLPTFASLLDHSNIKNSLLPRIKKLCLSTSTLSVRVNCLLCIGRLLENLDKWLVLDEVLPFLPQIPSREPAVLMGILGIYKLALNHKKLGISKEIIATRILPFLIPLCIENGLTLQQFNALVTLVKDMFQIVENDHRTKLEQLNSIKDQQKVLNASMSPISTNSKQNSIGFDEVFANLGLKNTNNNNNSSNNTTVVVNSMSLQEKQNVQQQQQNINLFSNLETLKPVKIPPTSSILSPKDLSGNLLSSNCNMINQLNNFQKNSTNFVGVENLNFSNPSTSLNNNPWSSTSNYNLTNKINNNSNGNWNSLDNLLSFPSTNNINKIPLKENVTKQKSSQDELIDFLS